MATSPMESILSGNIYKMSEIKYSKIAIVKLSAMGDIIHSMVVLQYIKKANPNIQIDWIVEKGFVPLLENNPDIDNILPVNLKAIKKNKILLFEEIKKLKMYAQNNYDIVIDMQGLLKSAMVSKILGPNVGFDKKSIREKIASLFYEKSFFVPYSENVILRNMHLMSFSLDIGVEKNALMHKKVFLFFSKEDRDKTESYIQEGQKTILHILGSSWDSKIYPKKSFIEIINALEGNHLLVWGNNNEKAYADHVAKHTKARMLPAMNLNELKALISKADLVIGADSGPTHMAWAMNRPSITIFGPTPSKRNVFATDINKTIDCGKEIDPLNLDKKDYCIENIKPFKIIDMAKILLDRKYTTQINNGEIK